MCAESTVKNTNRKTYQVRSVPLCIYYKRGFCRSGDECRFYHQKKISTQNRTEALNNGIKKEESMLDGRYKVPENAVLKEPNNSVKLTLSPRNVYDLFSLTEEDSAFLKETEIKQLKKRFPSVATVKEDNVYIFQFEPSDPDWPFDVRNLQIEADFPAEYPQEVGRIEVLHSTVTIPLLLIKHLNRSILEWLKNRHEELKASGKVELMFRPFLKWLDKNIEELFIEGLKMVQRDIKAKASGIEFVPHEKLFSSNESNQNQDQCLSAVSEVITPDSKLESKQEGKPNTCNNNYAPQKSISASENQGTKILFLNLELTEGAAALTCTKVSIGIQCSRCKTSCSIISAPKKVNSLKCSKCTKDIGFAFSSSTIHQFSNVLGTVQLMDCKVVDINVVECHFLVDCLNCSKQVPFDGIHYGQKHKLWCKFCNQKMVIYIDGVKFQASKESFFTGAKYVPAKKIEKRKDLVVKEGEPLPNYGACKHYKQSYRWLRFPCCGRIYPCDLCHSEKELDHEMKFASRMICGYCAKEQPYSREKPCFQCSANLTKKSGSHWEGGKGCRNKIQMSKEDKQKYSGVSKTVSKKAQGGKVGKK